MVSLTKNWSKYNVVELYTTGITLHFVEMGMELAHHLWREVSCLLFDWQECRRNSISFEKKMVTGSEKKFESSTGLTVFHLDGMQSFGELQSSQ
mmetsp:Transcript_11828/g.12990  ORF Transcript_11828/g.12990 Transcript_11828/m.12990 type:complete len:94 (+) Transcript_11828:31-312(+)